MEVTAAITRKTTAQRRQYIEDDYEYDVNSDMESHSDEMDSSDDLDESGNKMKSFNSYKNIDGKFRNNSKSIETTGTTKKSSSGAASMKRMPTRKPDPRISNRNAIMARENRRKKKEQMEILQTSVEKTQTENRKLKKLLRDQHHQISRLTHESAYLRSILANKTEILSLLKSLQGNRTPITSSALNFVTYNDYKRPDQSNESTYDMHSCGGSISSKSPISSSSITSNMDDDKENDFDSVSASSPYDQCSTTDFQWESLLNEPTSDVYKASSSLALTDIHDMDDSEILSTNSSSHTVNIEHNYFNDTITNNKVADVKSDNTPGICLHVASGRVSLEFCATCHLNSQNAWCEEI